MKRKYFFFLLRNVVCLWSIGSYGRLLGELRLPTRSSLHKKKGNSCNWISLLWTAPTILLSSSKIGELFSWDLRNFKGKGLVIRFVILLLNQLWFYYVFYRFYFKPKLVHNDHTAVLFSIATPQRLTTEEIDDEESKKLENDISVWTLGQDRYILNTNLGCRREVLISYPTIGGPIQCFVQCPLDPNRY